ncbi:AAA+ family ATPase [Paracoccus sediminis]|uniref:AAA+ family ATPase n=1 Tax=Paracoccus sediminis TaxID=1214787 RepID=A0A238UXZ0_9RHOB|nr:hypothetical protein [Paracoccus sediminis]TBN52663.1 AAA+ family ATPase [Paracoccus sediminis]SNR26828.1 hypothetical protein SAMN06265378_101585 [Paracoccus sediminis]
MHRLLILTLLATPLPAAAQNDTQDGLGLVERGLGIIAQNLWSELGPDLERLGQDMGVTLTELAPMLKDLAVLVDDLGNYQTPERLANGDVLIRRRPDAPPPPPIGESLPGDKAAPPVPLDPSQPEIPL